MTAPPLRPVLVAATLAASLTACASPSMSMANEPFPPDRPNETQPGAKPPVPTRSPRAVPYEITLRIQNAPGPFAVVTAGMTYDVVDHRCLPRRGGMSGTRVQARHSVPITLEKVDAQTYRGVFHRDLYVDEDYYQLGTCEWKFQGVGFGLRATGAPGESRYGGYLFARDLDGPQPVKSYAPNRYYPRAEMDDYPVTSYRDVNRLRPEVRDKLITFEFWARRLAP